MARTSENIYQAARLSAGLTQEEAAEQLAVSSSAVRAYETDVRLPAEDIVERMCAVYGSHYLGLQHIQRKGRLLPKCVQAAKPEPLETATIKLVNRTMAFARAHHNDELLQIAEDGIIDTTERPYFDAIMSELDGIVQAALALLFAEEVREYA